MVDTSLDGVAELQQAVLEGRQHIADLIGETLRRAGERSINETGKGYRVIVGQSRWEGLVTTYYVECTDARRLVGGALTRYAEALSMAGWFAADPGDGDAAVLVEVIGDELLDRAPTWLCQQWEQLRSSL
ncbi:hypothetical protein LO763_11415 [Glycomyces sp. A-F 0318]|uniref:hypothetical protein n=1 Tax=Glycomyces amatae TaxID=2881355 RepID=UPI001E535E53|nr:hypothetical protein [Glycomyces amatae]MCD0444231.1 hypothetical protein [Glycomyces amatae]